MKVAVMQPYFFPYIGYFQLISAVDAFVIYDNIKYTKKGWINRNRLLRGTGDQIFSLPIQKGSDAAHIGDRRLADSDRRILLNQVRLSYRRAPHFNSTYALVEEVLSCPEDNLFSFLRNALEKTCKHLKIETPVHSSSSIGIDHALRGQEKVLALCTELGARTYINPPGGRELYSPEAFRERGVDLLFLIPTPPRYAQFGETFVPNLSIIDVLMFNSVETVQTEILPMFELV